MTEKIKAILLGASLASGISGYANAEITKNPHVDEILSEVEFSASVPRKFDQKIARAAADKAAQRIGTIRGTINHDENPHLVTPANLEKPASEQSLVPRPAWVPLEDDKTLPPLVQNDAFGLDRTLTGSIGKKKLPSIDSSPKLQWERFDHLGRLIKPNT